MVYEHEIPRGSRLYFGQNAKTKREIEQRIIEILYRLGYEEIVTPLFSYHQHEVVDDESLLVRIIDKKNRKVTLRADSTVDVVRLITKRLGRSTDHKKWFYAQPVFFYPTQEVYQIGAEHLGSSNLDETLIAVSDILKVLSVDASLVVSNIKIPNILHRKYGIATEDLKNLNIDTILKSTPWVKELIYLKSAKDIKATMAKVPEDVAYELKRIDAICKKLDYEHLVIAPLYYAKMRYYNDLMFRVLGGNYTLARGGNYQSGDIEASGFAIYIDNLIERREEK